MVPPDLPLDDDVEVDAPADDDDDEEDELEDPHALSATTAAPVASKARTDLVSLCTAPPPDKGLAFPAAEGNATA
jgi:hypothetical protein